MKKIDLSSILKIIDLKNILSIFLIIFLYFGVNTFYISKNKASNALKNDEITKLEESVKDQEKIVEEITANGNDSLQTLIGKLAAYETVLPIEKLDTLELELTLRQIAGSAIEISSISKNTDDTIENNNLSAKYELYLVKGVASLGILEEFLGILSFTSTPFSGTAVITVEDVTISVVRPKNSSASDLFDLQSSPNVDFDINLRVWYNSEKGIIAQAAEKAALSANENQDATKKDSNLEENINQ